MQQAIALFVLKSGAGFAIFKWIATLASDFLAQGLVGAGMPKPSCSFKFSETQMSYLSSLLF